MTNNKNNSVYTDNINESSDDDPIEINLKQYEKIAHRSLNIIFSKSLSYHFLYYANNFKKAKSYFIMRNNIYTKVI